MKLDPWPFVIAAYAVTIAAAALLSLVSWRAMRRAEQTLDESKRR